MNILLRIVIGSITTAIGLFLLVNTYFSTRNIGRSAWAETNLGSGGTYILMKAVGLVVIVVSVLYIVGIVKIF